jgi:hypothetical protein
MKTSSLPALVLAPLIALFAAGVSIWGACGGASLSQVGTTFTGSFSACAKADLGQVVQTVEGEVNQIIVTGGAALPGALASLAATVSLDTLECAIAAVEAAAATAAAGSGAGSGSGNVGIAYSARAENIGRARAWVAQQRSAGKK